MKTTTLQTAVQSNEPEEMELFRAAIRNVRDAQLRHREAIEGQVKLQEEINAAADSIDLKNEKEVAKLQLKQGQLALYARRIETERNREAAAALEFWHAFGKHEIRIAKFFRPLGEKFGRIAIHALLPFTEDEASAKIGVDAILSQIGYRQSYGETVTEKAGKWMYRYNHFRRHEFAEKVERGTAEAEAITVDDNDLQHAGASITLALDALRDMAEVEAKLAALQAEPA